MINHRNVFLFFALILGSFSDEAAQIIFALNVSRTDQIYLTSLLLILGMLGGIVANTLFSKISYSFSIRKVILYCLFLESALIIFSAFIFSKEVYVIISFLLGVLGGVLWSAVLIMIPMITENEEELNKVNKYSHTIRNMGFMIGPIIGGIITSLSNSQYALIIVGLSTLLASFFMMKVGFIYNQYEKIKKAVNGFYAIPLLLKSKKIRLALIPLMFTIILTSTLTVLIIVYLIDVIKLAPDKYGFYSAAISLSLAISPMIFVTPMSKLGEARAACLSAAFIGLGLLMLSLTENVVFLIFWGVVMGTFNGIQNTIMSAFMLKNIQEENRENYMPAYVLILQLCVFIGFLISMVITAEYLSLTFWGFGLLTIFCGVIGAIVNK